MEETTYHVVRGGEDTWQVIREGFKRPHIVRQSKAEAIVLAKRFAKARPQGRVVVYSADALQEREFRFAQPIR